MFGYDDRMQTFGAMPDGYCALRATSALETVVCPRLS